MDFDLVHEESGEVTRMILLFPPPVFPWQQVVDTDETEEVEDCIWSRIKRYAMFDKYRDILWRDQWSLSLSKNGVSESLKGQHVDIFV